MELLFQLWDELEDFVTTAPFRLADALDRLAAIVAAAANAQSRSAPPSNFRSGSSSRSYLRQRSTAVR